MYRRSKNHSPFTHPVVGARLYCQKKARCTDAMKWLPGEKKSQKVFFLKKCIRYILLKTGKKRTRKQVSSHIQVLARRMQRDKNITKNNNDGISGWAFLCLDLTGVTWFRKQFCLVYLRWLERLGPDSHRKNELIHRVFCTCDIMRIYKLK